jgi:hypothetical protein
MARLHTLYLPGEGDRFAFIVDQHPGDPLTLDHCMQQWKLFAHNCGAADVLVTDDTIEVIDQFNALADTAGEPEPEKPWEVRAVSLDEAPEAIQRLIGAAFGAGPFADLREPCRDGCCGTFATPLTDDEPATDNTPEGDDGAPATDYGFTEVDKPSPEQISSLVAEKLRVDGGLTLAVETDDEETPVKALAQIPDDELTERERRLQAILNAGAAVGAWPQTRVQRLDASGEPIGEPMTLDAGKITFSAEPEGILGDGFGLRDMPGAVRGGIRHPVSDALAETFGQSQLVASHVPAPPEPIKPERPLRLCGAESAEAGRCRLAPGHVGLHEFVGPKL